MSTLGRGIKDGFMGTPLRNCRSRLSRGLGSLGDMGLLMARAPSRCSGVIRELAVEGPVEGVSMALNTEERRELVEAGVAVELVYEKRRISVCVGVGEGRVVVRNLDRGGGISSSMEDIGVSLALSRDCWLSLSTVVTVSWLSSTKTEMEFLVFPLGCHPSKSGSDKSASSRESSDNRYASLFAFLGLLRGLGRGKNLLFSVGRSFPSTSFSSHRRAFLGGRAGASFAGIAGELDAVTWEEDRLG